MKHFLKKHLVTLKHKLHPIIALKMSFHGKPHNRRAARIGRVMKNTGF